MATSLRSVTDSFEELFAIRTGVLPRQSIIKLTFGHCAASVVLGSFVESAALCPNGWSGKPDVHDELLSRLKMIRVSNRQDASVDVSKVTVNTDC